MLLRDWQPTKRDISIDLDRGWAAIIVHPRIYIKALVDNISSIWLILMESWGVANGSARSANRMPGGVDRL